MGGDVALMAVPAYNASKHDGEILRGVQGRGALNAEFKGVGHSLGHEKRIGTNDATTPMTPANTMVTRPREEDGQWRR